MTYNKQQATNERYKTGFKNVSHACVMGDKDSERLSELVYLASLFNSQGLMSDGPGAGQ